MALFPPQAETLDKGHGRIETRRIWTSTALQHYTRFPYCRQVFRVERVVIDAKRDTTRREVVFGVTSLSAHNASPQRLLHLVRGHWGVENRLHWVRDVTFDEDRSQVRKRNGAQLMATLRNLAISVLRLAGVSNIARALRHLSGRGQKALRLIGL